MQQRMHANAEQQRCGSVAAEVRADTETVSYRTEEFLAARVPTSLKTSSHLAYRVPQNVRVHLKRFGVSNFCSRNIVRRDKNRNLSAIMR